jgi:parvulin-like peptidyl-prolyl isomerase
MKHTFPISFLLLLFFAPAGAQVASHAPTLFTPPSAPAAADRPVARVNDAVLTQADLVREEYAIFPYARQHNGIPKDLEPDIRAGALKMIVFEELVYQEALRRKIAISPARMQQAEMDFRKTFPTPEDFNASLQSDFHGSQQVLDEKIRRSLLIEALLKVEVDNKSAVSPAEVKAYYDKTPVRFQHPETFTFQTISVIPSAKATSVQLSDARKRADDMLRQAKATKSTEEFGLLAEKISDDDYHVMMGQHKPLPVDQLAPQLLGALRAMKLGDVSNVVQIDQIYTVVHLQEHSPAGAIKFQEVKAQLEKELPQTRKNQLRAELDKRLRQNAKIQEL